MKNYNVNNDLYKTLNEDDELYGELMAYQLHIPTIGETIDMFDPSPDSISWEYMAMCLGRQCQFGGGTFFRISLAEHAIHVAMLAARKGESAEVRMACLLVNAASVYIGAHTFPISDMIATEVLWYRNLIEVWENAIAYAVGIYLTPEMRKKVAVYVKNAEIMQLERNTYHWKNSRVGVAPHGMYITHMDETTAARKWLQAVSSCKEQLLDISKEAANIAIQAGLEGNHE